MILDLAYLNILVKTKRSVQPQDIQNLKCIITQVEHFYGDGWNTMLWEVGLIVGALGVVFPIFYNFRSKRELGKLKTKLAESENRVKKELKHYSNAIAWVIRANARQEMLVNMKINVNDTESYDRGILFEMQKANINSVIDYALSDSDDECSDRYKRIKNLDKAIKFSLQQEEAVNLLDVLNKLIEKNKNDWKDYKKGKGVIDDLINWLNDKII